MSDDVFAVTDSESVLDTLVGEGKKFSSVEELAKGKAQSDEHISTVEQENADLKTQLEELQKGTASKQTIEDLIKAVEDSKAGQQSSDGERPMSTEELQEAVRSIVETDKTADTKAANRAIGNELVLKRVDGNVEAARALVTERAAALGMSPSKLAELSEESPSAFASLIDPTASAAISGHTASLDGIRTDVLGDTGPILEVEGFKTKAWFDAKRKEVGHVKYLNDGAVQRELVRSINGLGERFDN